jgi:hypothetical protein
MTTAMAVLGDIDAATVGAPCAVNGGDLVLMTPAAATTQAEARQQMMMRGPVNVAIIVM